MPHVSHVEHVEPVEHVYRRAADERRLGAGVK